ncbi:hypothetical protein BTJ40_08995 [Microbulbifer sp. A4B17]|uniref:hypothetical protein n=1 Tax=Microbulbifer sp. A4B17 TaxID=359370 RepID=UPI000D52E9D8|nr:hypothetical protein [Microbulbifer sp. A4B17]AWF80935.1 hypothetical protein BTJ40_08995 [Microbulbifer sp. A4B17]
MEVGGISILQLIILLVLLLLFILPAAHVLFSSRSHGGAKFGWIIGILLFSWLAYAAFLIITQPVKDAQAANKSNHS